MGQYDLSQDYFRFMFAEGVEPTNNHSEQQIRHCVIDRRITQGTRGEAGQRYHERMWSAIATCKKQKRNFFTFLLASITAQLHNQPAPSLLPPNAAGTCCGLIRSRRPPLAWLVTSSTDTQDGTLPRAMVRSQDSRTKAWAVIGSPRCG